MNKLPNKELLRPDEVATYFDVSRKTIYQWVAEGKMEAIKISRLLRIPRKKVKKFQKTIE
jgi:excisionase family DNA binding protein